MLLKNGNYNGIINKIYKKDCQTKDGRKFSTIVANVAVENDKKEIKELKASFGMDYAKKYFKDFCGVSSSELPGKLVRVSVVQKSFINDNGEIVYYNEIKYCNLIGKDGQALVMKKDTENETDVELF